MKKVPLLLCMAFSLFSGFAVADQVVSCLGVVMATPGYLPADTGSPLMAAVPPLMGRIRPATIEDRMTTVDYTLLLGTGVVVAPSPTAYDTGDPV